MRNLLLNYASNGNWIDLKLSETADKLSEEATGYLIKISLMITVSSISSDQKKNLKDISGRKPTKEACFESF